MNEKHPLGMPGRELLDEGWTSDPKPGLYFLRRRLDDGATTEAVFAIVYPTGDSKDFAPWVETPNLSSEHPSWMNYFVDPADTTLEYLPYTFTFGYTTKYDEKGRTAGYENCDAEFRIFGVPRGLSLKRALVAVNEQLQYLMSKA